MTSLLCVIQIEKQMTLTSLGERKNRSEEQVNAHVLHLSDGSLWLVCICHVLLILFMMELTFRLFQSKLDYCGSDLTVMLFFQIFNN